MTAADCYFANILPTRQRLRVATGLAVLVLCASSGCSSLEHTPKKPWKYETTALSMPSAPKMPWSKSKDKEIAKADEDDEGEEKPKKSWSLPWSKEKEEPRARNDVAGPLQRLAMAGQKTAPVTKEDVRDAEEVKKGRELIEEGQRTNSTAMLQQAEGILAAVVKERDAKKFSWKKMFSLSSDEDRPIYDPIRAEAAFYLGETHFHQKETRKARDYYKLIVKDYPSTPFVDRSSRRLFEIAREWIGDQEFATSEEVAQVNLEEPSRVDPVTKSPAPHRWYHVNLTDQSRPRFDTNGYAIDALRTIWTYDSTGPLADDALMLAATYHLREGDYVESDRLFTLLREQFPKSSHLQSAFVIGSHVKLASYQGAAYEEEQLVEAKQLKESTLRLFPDAPEADRIRRELGGIQDAQAQRLWTRAMFWQKKGKPDAVAVYCKRVIEEYPESKYAEQARQELEKLGQKPTSSLKRMTLPPVPKTPNLNPFKSEPADDEPAKDSDKSGKDSDKSESLSQR